MLENGMALLITSFAASALFLATAEMLARFWVRKARHYYVRRPCWRAEMDFRPGLFWSLQGPVRWYVNRDGERGSDVPKTPGKVFRVLVAGGSFVECSLLDQDKTWPAVLERLLKDRRDEMHADDVHVGNIGISEADSGALRRIFEKVISRYGKLDLIILCTGVSNVLRWLAAGCPSGRPPESLSDDQCFSQFPDMTFGWRPRHTALAELARRCSFRAGGRVQRIKVAGAKKLVAARQRSQMTQFHALTEDPSGLIEGFEDDLRAILTIAKSRSNRVIVLSPPWFEKVKFTREEEAELWSGWVGHTPRGEQWQFVSHNDLFSLCSLIAQSTAVITREMAVEGFDLRPLLDPTLRTYYDHFHLTEKGAASAAEHVATFVLNGRVALVPNPVSRRGQRPGDVAWHRVRSGE